MQFLEQAAQNQTGPPAKGPLIDAKAQISGDSSIGQSTRVEERAIIKKSVVGRHCVIGKMTKIVGCVILDHCIIEDGYDPLDVIPQYPLMIDGFIEQSSRVAYLEGAQKLALSPNYRNVLPKQGSRPMPEVNRFNTARELSTDVNFPAGSYRNAKLEISDWTTAGVYDDEDSDEDEESGEDSEDVD